MNFLNKLLLLVVAMNSSIFDLCTGLKQCGCKKELCDFSDSACVSQAVRAIYPKIVAGRPGVSTSDPLKQNKIVVDLPCLQLTWTHAKLTGLKKSYIIFETINQDNMTYVYKFIVPAVTLESKYDVQGTLNGTSVNGKGSSKITYHNFTVTFRGVYELCEDDKGRVHTPVPPDETSIELGEDGEIEVNFERLYFGGKPASERDMQELEEAVRETTLQSFIRIHLSNVNDFLGAVPSSDILYRCV